MTKKFDVVIGNPPYQEDLIGDNETKAPPIYHKFMDAAFEVAQQAVLITPARFLSNAGQTPKSWNQKVLTDPHLSVAVFEPKSSTIFPGTSIDGGIAVTHRDSTRSLGPIGHLSHARDMESVVHKVTSAGESSISHVITEHPCKWSDLVFQEHPELQGRIPPSSGTRLKTNTFDRMAEVCHVALPNDGKEYVQILGLADRKRAARWVRRDYLITPPVVDKHKVVMAAADGAAVKAGRVLGSPSLAEPGVGFTQTFISIGFFANGPEAVACAKYLQTRFARAMLSVLKTTQHNSAIKWKHVPLQDFTDASDIDWSQSIPEIDQQLYDKYGLDAEEIEFIESKIKPMS